MQAHGLFGAGRIIDDNINETQKYIIKAYLETCFDIILDLPLTNAKMALQAISMETLSPQTVADFKRIDIWGTVDEVRRILSHPYPQNGRNDQPAGLLALRSRNDNTARPITREAVVSHIHTLVAEKISLLENAARDMEEKNSTRSIFSYNKLIARNQWVACVHLNSENEHVKLYLEGMRNNGLLFLNCYEISSHHGLHFVKLTEIRRNEFKPDCNPTLVYPIDDIQGRILKAKICKDMQSFLGRVEIYSGEINACYSTVDHSQTWATRILKEINIAVDLSTIRPKKTSCTIL